MEGVCSFMVRTGVVHACSPVVFRLALQEDFVGGGKGRAVLVSDRQHMGHRIFVADPDGALHDDGGVVIHILQLDQQCACSCGRDII